MNERSVQVIISGSGDHQVRLRVQSATPERSVAVDVGSFRPLAPARFEAPMGVHRSTPSAAPALLLELRWSEPAPATVRQAPRSEPAPLAAAWATVQRRRRRHG